jgi:hypothetical protein
LTPRQFFRGEPLRRKRIVLIIIKRSGIAMVYHQIRPIGRSSSIRGPNSFKFRIIDTVKLRSNGPCAKVSDETNSAGVNFGETQELTSSGLGLPFWKFPSSFSELGLKNIDRAAPGMSIEQSGMGAVDFTEDFFWSNVTLTSGDLIVDVSSILHGHGPQSRVIGIRPAKSRVKHNCSSSLTDSLDGSLRNAILVLSTRAREGDGLLGILNMRNDGLGSEGAIVSPIFLHLEPITEAKTFKFHLGSESIRS